MTWQDVWSYIDNAPDAECAAWVFGLLAVVMLARAIANERHWR